MSYLSGSKKLRKRAAIAGICSLAGVSAVFAASAAETKKSSTFGAVPNFYTVQASAKETNAVSSSSNSAGEKSSAAERPASNVREFQVGSAKSVTALKSASSGQQLIQPASQAAEIQQVSAAPAKQRGYQVTFPSTNAQPNFYTETARTPASRVAGWKSDEKMGVWKTAAVSANNVGSSVVNKILHKTPAEPAKRVGEIEPLNAKVSKLNGTTQSGVASWYGGKWHGRKTANGERYDMNSMTAAHKTLPFGTLVRVTNQRNGRSAVVRINNRGPFTKGRILDLSKSAASTLGFVGNGIARVKMEVVGRS